MGRHYEIVQSDKPLSEYFATNVKVDPETGKRPDLILKTVPYSQDVIMELKAPGTKQCPLEITLGRLKIAFRRANAAGPVEGKNFFDGLRAVS